MAEPDAHIVPARRAASTPPDVVIVGAPKCGTTSLYAYLRDHPGICASPIKEPNFFCLDTPALRVVDRWDDYRGLFRSARPDQLRLEADAWRSRLWAAESSDSLEQGLLSWDRELKERRINPGTSADLTVATLFADRLEHGGIPVAASPAERL